MDDVDSFERELHKAVNSKSIETLLSLCDDPTKKRVVLDFKGYYDKKSLVHYAAEFGSVDLLKRLVCLGANVKETAGSGKNTLHFACEKAERETHTKMLKLLLEYGANVNEHWGDPPYGHQPLFFALKHKLKENAKLLLEKGADISFKGRVTKIGWIDCFCLAAMNCPSLIPDFLNRGANPDTENDGSSVLIIAFENYANRNDLLALIKAGARQRKRW
ncbi:unnamed protein product [Mytilus edulis]|uniref:Uncharacterized protein n=1 Tax=Mytilus edulis TaxID=6550 RepID=A0A8S3PWL8_MYTED|nr:unnamed protein product [Mytilus edulis]